MVINKDFRTPRLVFTFLDTQHKLLYSLPGQTELNCFEGVFECFIPIFDLKIMISRLFIRYFQLLVRGSIFKTHPDTPKPISDCSVRWVEPRGANIFRTWPFYRKLQLKTQKCQNHDLWILMILRLFSKELMRVCVIRLYL